MSIYLRNLLRFGFIIFIQLFLLNKVEISWWQNSGFPIFTPLIYPIIIILLPYNTPPWVSILTGFFAGLIVDASMNTPGMHAFATVLIAYFRTNVLNAVLPRNLSDYRMESPTVKTMGWFPYMVYAAFLILFHHSCYFTIQLWNVSNLGYLLMKILATSITSMLFILAYALLFTNQQRSAIQP